MLTADPEGFPLGLAELGLKKPKAGGENTRTAGGRQARRAARLRLADLPAEENRPQAASSEEERAQSPWHLQRSSGRGTRGGDRGRRCGQRLTRQMDGQEEQQSLRAWRVWTNVTLWPDERSLNLGIAPSSFLVFPFCGWGVERHQRNDTVEHLSKCVPRKGN